MRFGEKPLKGPKSPGETSLSGTRRSDYVETGGAEKG